MAENQGLDALIAEVAQGRLSRRAVLKRAAALGISGPLLAGLLAACGGASTATSSTSGGGGGASTSTTTSGGSSGAATSSSGSSSAASPAATKAAASPAAAAKGTPGGDLKVAIIGEPPTLDLHWTTATIVGFITWSIYEPLFTWDANYKLIPMLAESLDVSSDGLTNTIKLRKGVPFHNGQEMKAADVVASIKRWATKQSLGKAIMTATDTVNTPDDYTVEFKMKQPFGTFASSLGYFYQGCGIYPKSVLDAAGDGQIKDFIGTGPYKFVERQPDRYIKLQRFKDYAALPGDSNGYGGHKYAYVDTMTFTPVSDEAARIAGLRSGDYHYLEAITSDQYVTLKDDSTATADILPPGGWDTFVFNWKSPLLKDQKLRSALQAALNHEQILQASRGKGFYRLSPSIMQRETVWVTDAGKELYNINDPAKAKQLAQQAGYDGTPIRFMTTKEYLYQYNGAVVGKQQLEAAGFKVDLQVYDWATLVDRRTKSDLWDIFTTGISFRPDPTQLAPMQLCNWPGWWCSQPSQDILAKLQSESDFNARFKLWEQLQTNFYQEVPMIKLGDTNDVSARARALQNLSPQQQLGPQFWNVWLKK